MPLSHDNAWKRCSGVPDQWVAMFAETLLVICLAQLVAHVARSSVGAVIVGVGAVGTCVTFI